MVIVGMVYDWVYHIIQNLQKQLDSRQYSGKMSELSISMIEFHIHLRISVKLENHGKGEQ